jgi:hypothetical protein
VDAVLRPCAAAGTAEGVAEGQLEFAVRVVFEDERGRAGLLHQKESGIACRSEQ